MPSVNGAADAIQQAWQDDEYQERAIGLGITKATIASITQLQAALKAFATGLPRAVARKKPAPPPSGGGATAK